MNKRLLLDQIIAVLSAELDALTTAANASFAAATDPDSKAENKYDTRSLEASYVARGQAQRVADLQEAVHVFNAMSGSDFDPASLITLGTLVTLKSAEGLHHYFIATHAGGTEVVSEGSEVFVITPASPLGQKLMARRQGDRVLLRPGVEAVIESVR